MTVLTEEMILAKTRCSDIERVRNLNMFGSELEDVKMLKVSRARGRQIAAACVLATRTRAYAFAFAPDTVPCAREQGMPNLEVLSLSHNKITSLRSFSNCGKLLELYLRKNAVGSRSQRAHSCACPGAQVLRSYAARRAPRSDVCISVTQVADLHEVHSLRGLKYLHTLWLEVCEGENSPRLRACVAWRRAPIAIGSSSRAFCQ